MSVYICLVNYTDQGIRNIKSVPSRADASRALAKSLRGEIKDIYLTLGAYDVVLVLEMPDDETAAKFALALGAQGNVRMSTLRAFTEPEFRQIVTNLP